MVLGEHHIKNNLVVIVQIKVIAFLSVPKFSDNLRFQFLIFSLILETTTILELAESKRETSSLEDRSQEDYGSGLPLQPHIIPLHRYIVEQAKSSGKQN